LIYNQAVRATVNTSPALPACLTLDSGQLKPGTGVFMSSSPHYEMWKNIGLNLPAHDQLMSVLGQVYPEIYLKQADRPESMSAFDAFIGEIHGKRVAELLEAQKEGRKVIGSFCVFVPEEMIIAANAISVGLCAGAELAFDEAEKLLPRNTCSLIKSIFGFKLAKVCPYFEVADMVVGENTCDGKKKSYEQLGDLVKNLYVMDMPQMKSDAGRALLREEYAQFKTALEELTGNEITEKKLAEGIKIVNAKRAAIKRLNSLRKHNPAPISGLDALLINQISFFEDPVRFTRMVSDLCDELEKRIEKGEGVMPKDTPRVVISGCPMAIPNWKLPWIIETTGAVIVGEESCVGERSMRWFTDETVEGMDQQLDAITDRYFKIDCAVFTPNPERTEHAAEMVDDLKADGLIHYGLQFCAPYTHEALPLEKYMEERNVPTLRIETDYSQEDAGQLKTRIEAFVERIQA
jgi:benzoyl-CoA reductase/2-hydroxyglutaryl-CoA dehydratase subunit BcrC/BadD/HgdB